MNPSMPLANESGRANILKSSKNVTLEDVNKNTSIKKRRQIDRTHITILPGIPESYKCNVCEKIFRNKKNMCYHDACVTGIKPHKCHICEKSFIKRSHFEYHERVHSGFKPFKCSLCDKAFPQKYKLNRHMSSHEQQKQFSCQKCDKRYSDKEGLRNHMFLHTGQKSQHVCKSCGKAFRCPANLNTHMHTHSLESPHMCEFCKKSFKLKSLLIRHKKTHGKDKPFSCAHCSQCFLSKSDLRRHLPIHTDIKPFNCTLCNTVFRRKDNLNRHIRHHHAENSISKESSKPDKEQSNVEREDATKSSGSVATAPVCPKSTRIKKSKVKKAPKAPEIVPPPIISSSKPQAISLVKYRDEASRKVSLGIESANTTITTVPIPIRRPGELSNAVPVINGPIMGKNRATDCGQRKKTFTHTEPIPLAEAVVINQRIEEKLYPQSSGSSNYYFLRKHPSMSESATTPLGHSLTNIGFGNNSESYNQGSAKPSVVSCIRVQGGSGSKREVLPHTYAISTAPESSYSTGAGLIRGKCDAATPKIIDRRASLERHETEPKPLGLMNRHPFLGIESANSVPTIRINKRIYLQEKRMIPPNN